MILLTVIPNDIYQSKIIAIVKDIINKEEKIGYITTSKTYNALYDEFKRENIDVTKLYFIDGITKTIMDHKPSKNCIFISSPSGTSLVPVHSP